MTVVNGWPPVPGPEAAPAFLTDDAAPLVFLTDEDETSYLLEG